MRSLVLVYIATLGADALGNLTRIENELSKLPARLVICTLFTGQPVRRAFLCVIVMSLN